MSLWWFRVFNYEIDIDTSFFLIKTKTIKLLDAIYISRYRNIIMPETIRTLLLQNGIKLPLILNNVMKRNSYSIAGDHFCQMQAWWHYWCLHRFKVMHVSLKFACMLSMRSEIVLAVVSPCAVETIIDPHPYIATLRRNLKVSLSKISIDPVYIRVSW